MRKLRPLILLGTGSDVGKSMLVTSLCRLVKQKGFNPAPFKALSARTYAIKTIWKYGRKHPSPNAGYPEAALAGILDCRFGGPNFYHGQPADKPYIGSSIRPLAHEEFKRVAWINHKVSFLTVLLIYMLYYLG